MRARPPPLPRAAAIPHAEALCGRGRARGVTGVYVGSAHSSGAQRWACALWLVHTYTLTVHAKKVPHRWSKVIPDVPPVTRERGCPARASLTMDLLKRGYQHGLADWVTTFIIAGLGLCAEKGLAPFEHELGPQLADPHISYPYTPNAQSHCPKSLLIALAFILPLALIASTQLLAPSTLDLNHALLGMISSLSYTLLLVALIKAAVGRLRPDFLARCVPVDGVCTGVPAEVTEGRKSASCPPPEPCRSLSVVTAPFTHPCRALFASQAFRAATPPSPSHRLAS